MTRFLNAQAPRGQGLCFSLRFLRLGVSLLFAGTAFAQAPQPAAQPAAEKSPADELLKKGVQAFKSNDFEDAIALFQKATEAEPGSVKAHVYLATAQARTYIPGDASEENVARGRRAIAGFRSALEIDATDLHALDGLGALLYHVAQQPYDRQKLMESRSFHYRHTQLKPEDPEPHYWVA
jgi:Tfp pilus assembly protein PilF